MSSVLVHGVERSGQLSSRKGLKSGGASFEGQLGPWHLPAPSLPSVSSSRTVDLTSLSGGTCGCRRPPSFMPHGSAACRDRSGVSVSDCQLPRGASFLRYVFLVTSRAGKRCVNPLASVIAD